MLNSLTDKCYDSLINIFDTCTAAIKLVKGILIIDILIEVKYTVL